MAKKVSDTARRRMEKLHADEAWDLLHGGPGQHRRQERMQEQKRRNKRRAARRRSTN